MAATDIIAYVSIAVDIALCLICICWVSTFYLLRKDECIAPRFPISSIIVGFLCIFGLSVTFPLTLLLMTIDPITEFSYHSLMTVLTLLTIIGLYHVFTFRGYILYFNIKWQIAIEDRQWRIYIDPEETDWYLNNKKTWGNKKRVAVILLIHLSVWFILTLILALTHHENTVRLLLGCSAVLPTIVDIIIYILFPKFDDVWGITKEIKWSLAVIFVIIVLYTLSFIFDIQHHTSQAIIFSDICAICLFIYVYIMHYQPLKQWKLPTNPLSAINYMETLSMVVAEKSITKSFRASKRVNMNQLQSQNDELRLTLKDVLHDEDGFVHMARHLTHSFCIETLLFLVETQQWLETVRVRKSIATDVDDRHSFTLPSNAPKSKIVNEDSNEYLQCAKLFKKYIVNGAYFCVNISAKRRTGLYQQFGYHDDLFLSKSSEKIAEYLKEKHVSHEALFHSFDVTRKEVFGLMDSSFQIFKKSDVFEELKKSINAKKQQHMLLTPVTPLAT